jgi:3-hydroxyisobutyrate dehydrogenase-like beta-hydroxyacid dehydrogenase
MRIGFIGLGVQGKQLALNVRSVFDDVIVYDPQPEPLAELQQAGAAIAASAKDVGSWSDVAIICVRDDQQARDAILSEEGVLAGMKAGGIVLVHSTLSPGLIPELNAAAMAKGVVLVDAPVSGGTRGAKARTMSFMVGGPKDAVDKCEPLLRASGNKICYTGGVGTGTKAKTVHQLIVCVTMLAAYEGMRMGIAAGLSPEILTTVVQQGGAQSHIADHWFELSLRPHAVDIFDKDLSLCLAFAKELGLEIPGAALAKQRIDIIVP